MGTMQLYQNLDDGELQQLVPMTVVAHIQPLQRDKHIG